MAATAEPKAPMRHLLGLPQEIQDIIFDLAYFRPLGVKLLSYNQWRRIELERLRHTPSTHIRPIQFKVSDFLESKRWFRAAAKSYITSQPFSEGLSFVFNSLHQDSPYGIVLSFATEVMEEVDCSLSNFWKLPNLKILHLAVHKYCFAQFETKRAWVDDLTEDELETCWIYRALCRLSGLLEFTMISRNVDVKGRERETWEKNVKAFESAIKPHVTRPKQSSPSGYGFPDGYPESLYPGSFVFLDPVKLQDGGSSDMPDDIGVDGYESATGSGMPETSKKSESLLQDFGSETDQNGSTDPEKRSLLAKVPTWTVKSVLGKRSVLDEPDEHNLGVKRICILSGVVAGVSVMDDTQLFQRSVKTQTEVSDQAKTANNAIVHDETALPTRATLVDKHMNSNYGIHNFAGLQEDEPSPQSGVFDDFCGLICGCLFLAPWFYVLMIALLSDR